MILEGNLKAVRKSIFLCLLQFEKNENTELQIQSKGHDDLDRRLNTDRTAYMPTGDISCPPASFVSSCIDVFLIFPIHTTFQSEIIRKLRNSNLTCGTNLGWVNVYFKGGFL